MINFDLSNADVGVDPFPCFCIAESLTRDSEQCLLGWLESEAPWKITVMDFYEQYEFDFKDVKLPDALKPIISDDTLNYLRRNVGDLLGANLQHQIDVTAHKLNRTQKIRIHNDARPGGETHRLLVQLNRGWNESNGGLLMLFEGPEVETLNGIITPTSRSAFGFEISNRSYHAVSEVHQGDRYTLVFSFYAYAS